MNIDSSIALGAVLLAALASCSSGGGSQATVSGPDSSGLLRTADGSASLVAGTGVTTTLRLELTDTNVADPVMLTAGDLPAGVAATFVPDAITADERSELQLTVDPAATVGSFPLTIRGDHAGSLSELTLTMHILPAPSANGLTLRAPSELVVTPGETAATVLDIERAFGVTGDVSLSVTGAPSGMSASFGENPVRNRGSQLLVACADDLAPGLHALTVRADATTDNSSGTRAVLIRVVEETTASDHYLSRIAYGQSFLAPAPVLVADKPMILRAHVLADRDGQASPRVRLTGHVDDNAVGTLDMTGPAVLPTRETPSSTGTSFFAEVPAGWVQPGLELRVDVDPDATTTDPRRSNNTQTIAPTVGPALTMELVLVPVVLGSNTGAPLDVSAYRDAVLAMWPYQTVNVQVRAAYTATSVTSVGPTGSNWSTLLNEISSLRSSDGSSAHYYGLIDLPYGAGVVGMGYVGYPVAIGSDSRMSTFLHELGHNLGLRHAPCGGPSGPDANYPFTNAETGTWGYDARTASFRDPSQHRDLMSYCGPNWVSDYNFEKVRADLSASVNSATLATTLSSYPMPRLHISGRILRNGQVALDAVRKSTGPLPPAQSGTHELRLLSNRGLIQAAFTPRKLGCGAASRAGETHFDVTCADPGMLTSMELWHGQTQLSRQVAEALPGDAGLQLSERDGALQLAWDASQYGRVDVVHCGAERTTLALERRGGRASLDTSALPAGGHWEITFSAGLHTEVQVRSR